MPGPVLHAGATVLCPHGGQATPTAPFARVTVGGQPITTLVAPYVVAGCALPPVAGGPCATAQWITGAVRVVAGGAPLLIQTGQSICVPTGVPLLPVVVQARVVAT